MDKYDDLRKLKVIIIIDDITRIKNNTSFRTNSVIIFTKNLHLV